MAVRPGLPFLQRATKAANSQFPASLLLGFALPASVRFVSVNNRGKAHDFRAACAPKSNIYSAEGV